MTIKITPEAVKERIAALESSGEISLKEQFYLEYMRESLDKDRRIEQLTAERDALREEGIGTNTKAAADIYFQLVEELDVPPGGSLVQCIDNMRERLAALESRTVKLPQRHITQFRKGFDDYHNEMVYKVDEVLVSLAAAGIEVEAEKIKIVLQELKEDGVLTTYSNGHVEMLPYRIDENGEEYVEMLPNDIEQH